MVVTGHPWLLHSSFQPLSPSSRGTLPCVSPLCLCVWTSFLSLIKTPVFGFRNDPNLAWSYQLSISVVTLFLNRSPSEVVGRRELGRGPYSKQYTSHFSKPADSSLYPPAWHSHTTMAAQLISAHAKESRKKIKIIVVLHLYVLELLYSKM